MNIGDERNVNLETLMNCYNSSESKKEIVDVIELYNFWPEIKNFIQNKEKKRLFQVKKEHVSVAPETPLSISRYVTYDLVNPYRIPQLIIEDGDVDLDKHKQIHSLYNKWYDKWEDWSNKAKEIELLEKLYNRLLNIFDLISNSEDNYEIVFTDSIMAWNYKGQKIFHPLFTSHLGLEQNLNNRSMDIFYADERTKIDVEFLQTQHIENVNEIIELKRNLEEQGFDTASISEKSAKKVANNIIDAINPDNGYVDNSLISLKQIKLREGLVIYNCPLIIVKRVESRKQFLAADNEVEGNNDAIKNDEVIRDNKVVVDNREIKDVDNIILEEGVTITSMKEWIKDNEDRIGWIKDSVEFKDKPPITDEQFAELISFYKNTEEADVKKVQDFEIIEGRIPKLYELEEKIQKSNYIKEKNKEFLELFLQLDSESTSLGKADINIIDKYLEFIKMIYSKDNFKLTRELLTHEVTKEIVEVYIRNISEPLNRLLDLTKTLSFIDIELPEVEDIKKMNEDLQILEAQLKSKGKISLLFKLTNPRINYILTKCKVDGEHVDNLERIKIIREFLEKVEKEKYVLKLRNSFGRQFNLSLIEKIDITSIGIIKEELELIDLILKIDFNEIKSLYTRIYKRVNEDDLFDIDKIMYTKRFILALDELKELNNLKKQFENITELFSAYEFTKEINILIDSGCIEGIKKFYLVFDQLSKLKEKFIKINSLDENLKDSLPLLWSQLKNADNLEEYKDFEDAFKLARWKSLLKSIPEEVSTGEEEISNSSTDFTAKKISPFEENSRVEDFKELSGDLIYEFRDSSYAEVEDKNDLRDEKEIQNLSVEHIYNSNNEITDEESTRTNLELEELKKGIEGRMHWLTPAQQKVAEYIINNIDEVSRIGTAINFGKAVGVSSTTVLMTLMRLGLGSYTKFKEILKKVLEH